MIRNAALLMCEGVRVGYLSDVHTEFLRHGSGTQHVGSRHCDVMALAGDIGDPFAHSGAYKRFLEACTHVAKHTLVLPGNHEYYQGNRFSMNQTKTKIASICDSLNKEAQHTSNNTTQRGDVRFMDNSVFVYPVPGSQESVRFICSTLWSDIDNNTGRETAIYNSINDYNCIMGFTPARSRSMYRDASAFINDCLAHTRLANTTDIVVTHHAPSTYEVSAPEYRNSPLSSAFATDFRYAKGATPPHAWIFGHTHYNVARYDEKLDTLLLSNQVGYKDEDCGFVCDWDLKSD